MAHLQEENIKPVTLTFITFKLIHRAVKKQSEAIHLKHDRPARKNDSGSWRGLVVSNRNRLASIAAMSLRPNYNGVL